MADLQKFVDEVKSRKIIDPVPEFKIRIRWKNDDHDSGGTVQLIKDKGSVLLSQFLESDERIYGACIILVKMLNAFGSSVKMPYCLQDGGVPDKTRED